MKIFGVLTFWVILFTSVCLSQSVVSEEVKGVGRTYIDKAFTFHTTYPDSAIYYLEKALPILREEENWSFYTGALNGLFSSYYHKSDFELAEKYALQAVETAEAHLDEAEIPHSPALINLGLIMKEKGDFDEALVHYKKALLIAKSSASPNNLDLSRIYGNLGVVYRKKGDFEEAIRFYEQSKEVFLEANNAKNPRLAGLIFRIGKAYESQHEFQKALTEYKKVPVILDYFKLEKCYRQYINSYQSMVQVYLNLDQVDSASLYLDKVNKIQREVGKKYNPQTFFELNGKILQKKGNYKLALVSFQQALDLRARLFENGLAHPAISHSFEVIGDLHVEEKHYSLAIESYQHALASLCLGKWIPAPGALPDNVLVYQPLEALPLLLKMARTYQVQTPQQNEKALACCQMASQMINQSRNIQQTTGSKLWWGQKARPMYELGLQISYQLYQDTGEKAFLEKAFAFAEQSKAMVLFGELQAAHAQKSAGLPEALKLRENKLKVDISFLKNKVFVGSRNRKKVNPELISRWKKQLFEKEEAYRELILQLEKDYPTYYQFKYDTHVVTSQEVRDRLPDSETAMALYFEGESHLYVFVIGKESGLSMNQISHGDTYSEDIDAFIQHLHYPQRGVAGLSAFSEIAYKNGQRFLQPVFEIGNWKSLILIPDGKLNFIPFEALLTEAPQVFSDSLRHSVSHVYRTLPYLIKKSKVHYGFSASIIQKKSSPSFNSSKNLAAFAPDYTDRLALFYNQTEAKSIADLTHGDSFRGAEATEATFKSIASDYRALHFVMHGLPDDKNPMYSHLLFSKSEEDADGNDGKLHVFELYNLQLNSKLVTLAACETGYGKLIQGEGILSLARAFRFAGCPNIINSLWKADGRASHDIMTHFYKSESATHSISDRLHRAKLNFLTTTTPDMVHPHYWATFVLVGENGTLSMPFSFPKNLTLAFLALAILIGLYWGLSPRRKEG